MKFKIDLYNPNEHFVNIEIGTLSFLNSNRIPLKVCIRIDLDSKYNSFGMDLGTLSNNSL